MTYIGYVHNTKKFREISLACLVPLCKCTNSYLNDSLYLTSGNQILVSIKQLIHFLMARGLLPSSVTFPHIFGEFTLQIRELTREGASLPLPPLFSTFKAGNKQIESSSVFVWGFGSSHPKFLSPSLKYRKARFLRAFRSNGQKMGTKLTKGSYHRRVSGLFTGADQYSPKSSKFRFFCFIDS